MADQNRSANDQLLQLQRQSAEDKKKNKNLQDDLDTATQEKNKFKRDLQLMENELDKRDDVIQEKTEKIDELLQKQEKLATFAQYKKLYEDLQTQNEMNDKKLCGLIIENKTRMQQILDPLQETTYADPAEDISKMNRTDKSGMVNLMMELLREEYRIHEELEQEVQAIQNAKKSLAITYEKLNQENQVLKTSYEDLKIRHDAKVDLVGKLTVKLFVFSTMVEKLYTKGT